ncbi:hypothetical protein HMPREF0004_4639 [Achromobacter piechaudii ATCC 43553]|uniref:Uncharacterized protein n=1 Tax=Achromobacter piechaudii ATCC 43553 TaxID=742159 RepID=D4XGP2_9BURK|nr:hypothetical protein HMPREF0004_4639 [Achromobacter piechaudii ATCC 43553]
MLRPTLLASRIEGLAPGYFFRVAPAALVRHGLARAGVVYARIPLSIDTCYV